MSVARRSNCSSKLWKLPSSDNIPQNSQKATKITNKILEFIVLHDQPRLLLKMWDFTA